MLSPPVELFLFDDANGIFKGFANPSASTTFKVSKLVLNRDADCRNMLLPERSDLSEMFLSDEKSDSEGL